MTVSVAVSANLNLKACVIQMQLFPRRTREDSVFSVLNFTNSVGQQFVCARTSDWPLKRCHSSWTFYLLKTKAAQKNGFGISTQCVYAWWWWCKTHNNKRGNAIKNAPAIHKVIHFSNTSSTSCLLNVSHMQSVKYL